MEETTKEAPSQMAGDTIPLRQVVIGRQMQWGDHSAGEETASQA
jgi:hypothetical protein